MYRQSVSRAKETRECRVVLRGAAVRCVGFCRARVFKFVVIFSLSIIEIVRERFTFPATCVYFYFYTPVVIKAAELLTGTRGAISYRP